MQDVIFDTDMGNDIDDALALATLHALQSRGLAQVRAVTLTRLDPASAVFCDALNRYYGRTSIPVGIGAVGPKPGPSPYLKVGERLPHKWSLARSPEAVALIRKTLAESQDGSVALVQVGFFSNLVRLLDRPEDRELVRRKVKFLSVMAGAFAPIGTNSHFCEYNVTQDIPAAQKLAQAWPTPIVWNGFEIGDALRFPRRAVERGFGYDPRHPLKEAYEIYCQPKEERPCWDLASVLHAVCPDDGYFSLSPAGEVTVEPDGFTRFVEKPGGRDRFLKMDALQQARTLEALAQLATQPPR